MPDNGDNWPSDAFSFLPNYASTSQNVVGNVTDYVYSLFGDFGTLYAGEPSRSASSARQLMWTANEIRFHYPSEHKLNNNTYDMEMQIIHNVTFTLQ